MTLVYHWYKANMRIKWYAYHKMMTSHAGSEVYTAIFIYSGRISAEKI